MSRIPTFSEANFLNKTVDEVFTSIETIGKQYESGFAETLMHYIKTDEALKNFYIRYVYECECTKQIIACQGRDGTSHFADILAMIVDDMKKASSIDSISVLDSQFHRMIFCAVNEQNFFEWYKLNSESLQTFLNNFWKAVGIGTDFHRELIEIHENIYKCIIERNEKLAIEYVQKHFAILLLKLLGMMY